MSNTQDLTLFGSNLVVGDDITLSKNVVTPEFNVSAFNKSLGVTAVDVFVYDTSKDSDGGAWRQRTQHTSWYNETLNTATRGVRKEFPSVAIIVYVEDVLRIYDGDDPDMPMWMIFNGGAGKPLYVGGTSTCCAALNGEIVAGQGINASGALSQFNFIKDYASLRVENTSLYNETNILDRNTGWPTDTITGTTQGLVSRYVNDVAMTVLPSAPIDSATGLPVPTIAVGTVGGTSVITDSGNVYDITGFSPTTSIDFYGSKLAFSTEVNSDSYITVGSSTVTSDIAVGIWRDYKGEYSAAGTQGIQVLTDMADHLAYGNAIYSAGVNGLTAIDHNESDGTLSMGAIIVSDYNTGWMPGDIKLATLSQKYTDGLDLITNGHFDTDTSGWTAVGGAVLSVVGTDEGNRLRLESNGPASPYAYQQITTVIGETYKVTYDGYYDTVNYKLSVGTTQGGTELTDTAGGFAVDTHTTLTFAATSTTTYISLYLLGAGEFSYAEFDNISVSLSSEIFGEELVTNGDFATGDLTGWTDKSSGTGTTTVNGSNQLELYRLDASNVGWAQQAITTVSGSTYLLTVNEITDGGAIFIGSTDGGSDIYGASAASGINIVMFTATSTTTYVGLRGSGNGTTSVYDDVSLRLAEEDRSVNNKGLQRFDTIQKVPLLPGSDLVSFNFDQGYLLQPYNPDLNFGTGDFSIIGWAKLNEDAAYADLLYRSEGTGNNQFGVFVRGPSGVGGQENCLGFYMTDSGGSSLQSNPPNVIQVGIWFQYCVVRTGTDVKIYINSKLVDTTTMATDHTSTTATLLIGGTSDPDVEQSLLRISTTAPAVEQISKIYEDEKFLFQENAKATLYGTSSAVTALAYDDTKNLLHVGTSSGRSIFQGLRRVDNTTDPVTTAISAVNGLVTEE